MFADACRAALKYTRPVAVSVRQYDGSVRTDYASFIILNREGWAITAGHVFDSFVKFTEDKKKMAEINEINANRVQKPGSPISEIRIDKTMLTNHSFWWGWDGVAMNDILVNRQADIAIGRLENFNPAWVEEYPVFAEPSKISIGESICRLGYPFIEVIPKFHEESNAFEIPKVTESAAYATDGMISLIGNRGRSKDNTCDIVNIETASPGLRGQSGGPMLDREGHLCGMQVMTVHRALGFHPMAELDGQKYLENQFLNAGVGLHISTIMQLLDSRNVRYQKCWENPEFRIVD